ncbi:MAG: hypothetical protein H0T89_28020 [Deltaproteobacteria bacterium]|nr:hypothetical protein [Deltaproteobacteria bacterium]MDQ3298683.1 hypothetical protein [Myxococcota bacterium]
MAIRLPLIPLAVAIVWWTIAGMTPESQDATVPIIAVVVAVALLIVGLSGMSVPWFPPRTLTCTAEGVTLDGVLIPAYEVGPIVADSITRRYKGVFYGICISITTKAGKRHRMELIQEHRLPVHPEVEAIVREMKRVLSAVGSRHAGVPADRF